MSSKYCHHLVEDIFKKYDSDQSNSVTSQQLTNEWSSKHKRANLKYFNSKYSEIVETITTIEHPTGFIDKRQLFK